VVQTISIFAALATLLVLFGSHSAVVPGSTSAIFLTCLVGAFLGLRLFYQMIDGQLAPKLTTITAAGLSFAYCAATLVPFVGNGLADIDTPPQWITYALSLMFAAVAVLLLFGLAEPNPTRFSTGAHLAWKREGFLWLAIAAGIVAFVTGALGFGEFDDTGAPIDVFSSLVGTLVTTVMPLAAIGIAQSNGLRRWRFILIFLLAAGITILTGRRQLAYGILISMVAAVAIGGAKIKMKSFRDILMAVGAGAFLTISGVIFLGLRSAAYVNGEGQHESIVVTWRVARETTLTDPQSLWIDFLDNVVGRSGNLTRYLSLLTKGGETASPMYGADLKWAIQDATPDAIYHFLGRDKSEIRLIASEEGVANEHFGLPVYDDANSLLTGGFIDFGVPGVFLYPLVFCFGAVLFLAVLVKLVNYEGQTLALVCLMSLFVQAETEIRSLLSGARDLCIVLVFWWILYHIPALLNRRRRTMGSALLGRSPASTDP
jgi:hypothetical protein